MVGGYFAFTFHVLWGLPYIPSLVLAVAGGAALGFVSDRLVFRSLIKAPPMAMVVATVALSFLLKGIARYVWGGQGEFVPFPPIVSPAPVDFLGVTVFPQQTVVFGVGLLAMALLTLLFRRTRMGKSMQATAESQRAAYLVGIRVERVYSATWAAAAALATLAAVLMAPLTQLTPDIGFSLLLKALAATVLGGLGNMPGAIIGGLRDRRRRGARGGVHRYQRAGSQRVRGDHARPRGEADGVVRHARAARCLRPASSRCRAAGWCWPAQWRLRWFPCC